MSVQRLGALVATFLALAGAAAAQVTRQRVLVPVFTVDPIPGVNGSSWTTDFWISNGGDGNVVVDGVFWDCFLEQCGPAPVEPGVTFHNGPKDGGLHGALLYVDASSAA